MRIAVLSRARDMSSYYRAYEPATVESLRFLATNLRLVMTGGTDFHGDRESYAEAHEELFLPIEAEERIRATVTRIEAGTT